MVEANVEILAAARFLRPYSVEMSLNIVVRPGGQTSSGNASKTSHQRPQAAALIIPVAMFMINAVTSSPGAMPSRTVTPNPKHVPPTVPIAQATAGIDWSIVLPTWLGALATVGLLAGAYFTALYAKKAFNEQSKEVQLIQDQLADQREINRRQAAVLDLQAAELRESLEERKRESKRDHRYQAVRVFPFVEPIEGQESQYCVIIKNSSDRPVYNVTLALHWSWADGERTLSLPECLDPVMMPDTFTRLPRKGGIACNRPKGSQPVWAQIWFRDAESAYWTVTSKGEIVEENGPPMFLGSLGREPADLEPGRIPRKKPGRVTE